MKMEKLGFQAEVSRLLDIVAHSLYSDRAVFLRELISNASDACDKLRYLSLTEPGVLGDDPEFKVTVTLDQAKKTLTVSDNGIGMNREDLISHLGTIARSGSAQFVQALEEGKSKDVSLIGQFGVGFYAAFMVADKVTVVSRKAGETLSWQWISDGKGEFEIGEAERAGRGTDVILHIKKDAEEFLEKARVNTIITKYSDHIALPIKLIEGGKEEKVNQAAALWTRSKSDITEEQYRDFYRHVAHAFDEPWGTLHFKAEGKIEYTGLLFIPTVKPFDLFHPDRKQSLKLYVKRVFITDHCEELLPLWLRFVKGLMDSEDLPLNISREMLQHNPVLTKIRQGAVKRVLDYLKKRAENEPDAYAAFWNDFGAVLKEGIYEDAEHKDALIKLARFRSTSGDSLVSLADYIGRMKEGQTAIYYLTGDSLEAAARSPQLEGYRAKGVEVLLLTDPVDEFWVPAVGEYEGKTFRSVTRGGADLDSIKGDAKAEEKKPEPAAAGIDNLVALMKLTLKDAVKDVRVSQRLTDSAVCLVADEGDMDMRLARLLQQHKRIDTLMPRVLEINGSHPVVAALAKAVSSGKGEAVADASWLLLDQARIQEGEVLNDPTAFAKRLGEVLSRAFA
ncbi:molecular chaperone HtpG [Dongia deserti]|uniref:molecular chaperone HtpG n=1 Tax=Dongia deserti TaxID=2268030 RepID=UPI000E65672D|nr:molecular chaperone HtpG [Dongia deserti]